MKIMRARIVFHINLVGTAKSSLIELFIYLLLSYTSFHMKKHVPLPNVYAMHNEW